MVSVQDETHPVKYSNTDGTVNKTADENAKEKYMRYYEENNEFENTSNEDQMDEEHFIDCLQRYQDVFLELEGISRVLGADHPTVKLMTDATEDLDEEKLEAAQAAFDALPEQVVNRARHPWIGYPPPAGIREKLRKVLIPELVGESYGKDPVGCYLQIDAYEGDWDWPDSHPDQDGHVIETALVYDPKASDWPVHVQILEGSDKKIVKDLLRKILDKLDEDWDELTDPDSYPNIFPVGEEIFPW